MTTTDENTFDPVLSGKWIWTPPPPPAHPSLQFAIVTLQCSNHIFHYKIGKVEGHCSILAERFKVHTGLLDLKIKFALTKL